MPGRQYTGRLAKTQSAKPHKSQRKQKKRAQNALAAAEAEVGDVSDVRRSRLGDVEPEYRKRQRDEGDDFDDSDDGSGGGQRKRTKSGLRDRYGKDADYGSDSEGNEWVTGQVNEEDDESLDSDEAFGESDQERFEGFAFRGSKQKGSRTKSKRANGGLLDEDNDTEDRNDLDSDAESDNFAENAVDLHTMLDDDLEEEQSESDGENHRKRQLKSAPGSTAPPMNTAESDEDEEKDEEDAHSALSIDDDEAEEDHFVSEARSRALLDMVTGLGNGDLTEAKAQKERDRAQEALAPTNIVAQGGGIEDLLESLDPSMRKLMGAAVQSGKKSGKGIPGKVEVPLPQRQQGRLDRAAAYEKSKETLARWIDTVKHNRRAEHLSFPLVNRDELSAKNVDRFKSLDVNKPFNELEATIQTILAENGLLQKDSESQEEDGDDGEGGMKLAEAPVSKLSLQDVLAQRAELRKARELLFREEIKAKRIKKIKSKAYRKVHRKARERGLQKQQEADAENGVQPDEDEQDRLDRLRAEARMGDKHRESRFAKAMKATGRTGWDEDARNGMLDMARREEELRKRIHGDTIHDEDSFADDSDGEDDDMIEAQLFRLREEPETKGPGSRLANMKFMQRAEAAKQKQNEETIAQIRRDLDGGESHESSTDEDGPGRRKFGPQKGVTLPSIMPKERNEFEERERSDLSDFDRDDDAVEIVTSTHAKPGDQGTISERSNTISDRRKRGYRAEDKEDKEAAANTGVSGDGWTDLLQAASKQSRQKQAAQTDVTLDTDADLAKSRLAIEACKIPQAVETGRSPPQNLLKQVRLLPSSATAGEDTSSASSDSDSDSETAPRLTAQQSALQRAFAGDEVTASFEAEKSAVAAEERSPSPAADVLPGWGSWTGGALSKRDRKERSRRNTRLQQQVAAAKSPRDSMAARKGAKNGRKVDQTRKDANLANVIISEKKPSAKSSKYLASALPHMFETKQQYERSLRIPVGPEWTTKETFQRSTKPRVLVGGGVIKPMEKPLI